GHLYIHRVTPDGASFTQKQEDFIKCSRITDVDCDASGRLYLGSWHGSGFRGGKGGFIARVVPKGWKYKPAPDFKKASDAELANLLKSPSAKIRLNAQQALLERGASGARASAVKAVAMSKSASLESRVAAIFTLKQLMGTKSHSDLVALAKDSKVTEFALRALADRTTQTSGVPLELFYAGLKSKNPRVQVAAAVGLGRLGKTEAAKALLEVANPPKPHHLPEMPSAGSSDKVSSSQSDKSSDKVYKTKVIGGNQTAKVDVDISGYKQLVLAVGDGGDGNGSDHGSWFEPVLVTRSGKKIKLTDLKWKKATQGWGKTRVNKDCRNKPLKRKDGKPVAFGIGSHSVSMITYTKLPKDVVRFQATVGNSDNGNGKMRFFVASSDKAKGLPKAGKKGKGGKIPEGPHATPNPQTILPHVAVKALVNLNAVDACLEAVGSSNEAGAIWALQKMHNAEAVNGLIAKLKSSSNEQTKQRVAKALVRLANKERPYDGSHWWGTKPDTRGPYYYPTPWAETDKIKAALVAAAKTSPVLQHTITELAKKDRVKIDGLPTEPVVATGPATTEPTVDLDKIKNQKGQVGKMSVEDVIVALDKIKGKPARGPKLFVQQGCVACHSLKASEPQKGPFLGQIGSIMDRDKIAMSILRPNAEISQGFKTVQIKTKKGQVHIGFVTKRLSDLIELRNIAGQVTKLDPEEVADEKLLPNSMMPPGLANGMSLEDFASLVNYLAMQKK
ncbi:MAG: NPCBM/NEW2 domain-containing protein, partial [Phycisphaeraceae bacterium]|nr:NPCBM/NEW2 domain-containing protein [Phycisphaeraceae bacterium]